jgi:hypothetical protein
MNNSLDINEQTSFKNDKCGKDFYKESNNKMLDLSFFPLNIKKDNKKEYVNSAGIRGVLQDHSRDLNGDYIDQSTMLRNGDFKNRVVKHGLDTRLFPGSPLLARGQSILKNPDLSSRLMQGEETRVHKSSNFASSYSVNNFIPLVPSIANNIQNTDHIIPTYWIRGGMSTRSVVRNIDYMKSCGIKR